MVFTTISREEAMRKFEKAEKKSVAINLIADLTAGSRKEVADFLGVKLLDKRPWVEKK